MVDRGDAYDFVYVQSDIPTGMTFREWRAQRAASRAASSRWPLLAGSRRRVPGSARNAVRRAEVERRVASLRLIAERLRAASR